MSKNTLVAPNAWLGSAAVFLQVQEFLTMERDFLLWQPEMLSPLLREQRGGIFQAAAGGGNENRVTMSGLNSPWRLRG